MPRLAANLTYLFTEHDFLDRFAAAAQVGFAGVELLVPYDHAPEAVAARLAQYELECVLINTPYGPSGGGHFGLGALPGREADFAADGERALRYAQAIGCSRIHALAGVPEADADAARCHATFVANLRAFARQAAAAGITVLIEPLNTTDFPGYFLTRQSQAHAIVGEVGAANLKMQLDFYHCQVMEGGLSDKVHRYFDAIGHYQIAAAPGRGEPDSGEINPTYLLGLVDELGYAGWIGAEYKPRAGTLAGLGWAKPYGIAV